MKSLTCQDLFADIFAGVNAVRNEEKAADNINAVRNEEKVVVYW